MHPQRSGIGHEALSWILEKHRLHEVLVAMPAASATTLMKGNPAVNSTSVMGTTKRAPSTSSRWAIR